MKIILIKEVESLGESGDTVNVKSGYARNYLLKEHYLNLLTYFLLAHIF